MGQHKTNPTAIKAKNGELKPPPPPKPTLKDKIKAKIMKKIKNDMLAEQKSAAERPSKHRNARRPQHKKTVNKART